MGIQSVIAEILFVRYVNSINTGTIEKKNKFINRSGKIRCRNASGNYVYMRSVKAKRKSMEQENASSAIYQRIEETSKCMESSFAGKVGLVHVICYPKKRKLITSNKVLIYLCFI